MSALSAIALAAGGLEIYGRFGAGGKGDIAYAATPSHQLSSAVAAAGIKLSDFFAAVGAMRMAPARPDKLILKGKGAAPKAFTASIPPAATSVSEEPPLPELPSAFFAVAPEGVPVATPLSNPGGPSVFAPPTIPSFAPPGLPGDDEPPIENPPPPAVPEPGTWLLLIGGFGLVGMQMRRRRKAETNRPAQGVAHLH